MSSLSKGRLHSFVAELAADLRSTKAIAALSAGATAGFGLLVVHAAYGIYVFSGPLAPYVTQGVGLVLFANFATCLVIALAGGFRGTVSGLPPALLLVMAMIGGTMDLEGEALFITATAALMLGATATGVLCILIGRFRLAACRASDGASRPNPDRVIGRLGLGQEALSEGNGSCGAGNPSPEQVAP